MARSFLIRGMLVGALAGVLAAVFAQVFGEPQVAHAIRFESSLAHLRHEPPSMDLVSRTVQSTAGLLTAAVLFGCAYGGLFGLTVAALHGRLGVAGVRGTAAITAVLAYVTVTLVPFLKYPANPPSVGNSDTIGQRTALYFAMLIISVAGTIVAGQLSNSLRARYGAWNSVLLGVACYLLVIGVAMGLLPAVNEVPVVHGGSPGFPATVLFKFRVASLGTNLVLFATLGIAFGWLAERRSAAARVRRGFVVSTPAAEAG